MSHWHEMENLTPEYSLSFKGCFHCIYGLKPPDSILPEGAMGTTKQLMDVPESSGNDTDVNIQPILESKDDDTAISNSGKQALENGNNGENLHEDRENLHEKMIQEKKLSQLVLSTRSLLQRSASSAKSLGQRSAGTAKFLNQQLVTKMNWELQQETGMCMRLIMERQMFEPPDSATSHSQFTLERRTPMRKKRKKILILLLYDGLLKVTWIDNSTKPDKKVILKCTILELKGWLLRLSPRQQEAVCRVFQQFCQALIQVMDESSAVDVGLPHNQLQQEGRVISRDDGHLTGLFFNESHDRAAVSQWIASSTLTESCYESHDNAAIARLTLNLETSGRHNNWISWNPGLAPLMTGCSAITAVSPSAEQRQMVEDAEIVKWSSTKTFRDMVGSCQFQFPPTIITVGRVQCTEDLIKEQQQEWRECVVPSGQRHVQRNTANHCFNAVLPLPDLPALAQAHPDVGGIREYVIIPSGHSMFSKIQRIIALMQYFPCQIYRYWHRHIPTLLCTVVRQ